MLGEEHGTTAAVDGGDVRHCTQALVLIVALVATGIFASAAELHTPTHKTQTIQFRLIATEDAQYITTLGSSSRSYIAAIESRTGEPQLARIVYRYRIGQAVFTGKLLDYTMLHKFRAVRDESCDVSVDALSYSYRFDESNQSFLGKTLSLDYARFAPKVEAGRDEVVPCYTLTPDSYKGSRALAPQYGTMAAAR